MGLTLLMGIAPMARASTPQPFSDADVIAMTSMEAQNPCIAEVTCGMSDDAKRGIVIALSVLALCLAIGLLAATMSDASEL